MWTYADNPYLVSLAMIYMTYVVWWLFEVECAEEARVARAHSCARCGSLARRDGGELMCSACIDELK